MQEQEKISDNTGFIDIIKKQLVALREWVKPKPGDAPLVTVFKLLYKGIALLVLVALSPVILLILLLVFFATL